MKEEFGNSEAEFMGGGGLNVTCALSCGGLGSMWSHGSSTTEIKTFSS